MTTTTRLEELREQLKEAREVSYEAFDALKPIPEYQAWSEATDVVRALEDRIRGLEAYEKEFAA